MEQSKKSKEGRPKLSPSQRKQYHKMVKMNTKEFYTLMSKAKAAGLSMSAYMRACCMSSTIVARINKEEAGIMRELCGMANNLNQLAYKANLSGYSGEAGKYAGMSEKIIDIINRLIKC